MKNPPNGREVGMDNETVSVWCTISVNHVFGMYYFESAMVTAESFKQVLTNLFTSDVTQCTLRPHFSERWCSITLQWSGATVFGRFLQI